MARPGLKPGQRHSGQFQVGNKVNPGGRPKIITEIRDLARQHTVESVEALVRIMRKPDASDAAVVAAAGSLLDRGWGRAPQTITIRRIEDMADGELDAYIADIATAAGIAREILGGDDRAKGPNGTGNGTGGLSSVH